MATLIRLKDPYNDDSNVNTEWNDNDPRWTDKIISNLTEFESSQPGEYDKVLKTYSSPRPNDGMFYITPTQFL